MNSEPITKITRTFQRPDGSEARIVATQFFGAGLKPSVGVYVLRRPNSDAQWHLCSQTPHPQWRAMPVDEYIQHGRSEMLQTVTPGEILQVLSKIGQPMSSLQTP